MIHRAWSAFIKKMLGSGPRQKGRAWDVLVDLLANLFERSVKVYSATL